MVSVVAAAVAAARKLDHLPGGDTRAIGAGYAMAITAIVVAALYMLVAGVGILLIVLTGVSAGGDLPVAFLGFGAIGLAQGVVSLSAVVAPLLFCTGIAAWRIVPPSQRYGGVIGGLLAMGLAYLVAGVLMSGLGVVVAVGIGEPLGGSLIGALGLVVVAFSATAWIALPVASLTGTLYERSESTPTTAER